MDDAGTMRARRRCPRCAAHDIWEAPSVADETWFQTFAMPAAWRQNGRAMGHLEVCACAGCGLVEWHTAALDEMEADEGVSLSDSMGEQACRACGHERRWLVERVRDVRSGMNDSKKREAHTRGLTYSVRGRPDEDDEPIAIRDKSGRGEALTGKQQIRNMLSHGALHGRPVGHLELRICAACGFTDWYAHGAEEARRDGKETVHPCAVCEHEKALELKTYDLRAEGINAKRVALSRTNWGNTRADMVLRVCLACSHTDWIISDTRTLEDADAHGATRADRDEGIGVYRRAGRQPSPEEQAPAVPPTPPNQALWLTVAAISAAVALYVLIHPAAALLPFPALAAWFWRNNRDRPDPTERADARVDEPLRVEEPPAEESADEDQTPSAAEHGTEDTEYKTENTE